MCEGFEISIIVPLKHNIFKDDEFLGSYVTDSTCIEQSSAPIENFQISSYLTSNECLKKSKNIVTDLSSPGHASVNCESHQPTDVF